MEGSFAVGLELALRLFVLQPFSILCEVPVPGIFVDVRPAESISTMRRISEIIDFVPGLPKPSHSFWLISVPPAGGNVNFCHKTLVSTKNKNTGL